MSTNDILALIFGIFGFFMLAYAAIRIGRTDFSKDLK
jgi:hypothetical protein